MSKNGKNRFKVNRKALNKYSLFTIYSVALHWVCVTIQRSVDHETLAHTCIFKKDTKISKSLQISSKKNIPDEKKEEVKLTSLILASAAKLGRKSQLMMRWVTFAITKLH